MPDFSVNAAETLIASPEVTIAPFVTVLAIAEAAIWLGTTISRRDHLEAGFLSVASVRTSSTILSPGLKPFVIVSRSAVLEDLEVTAPPDTTGLAPFSPPKS